MPFQLIKGDITKFECDAIVNAANNSLLGGGGVDGAIHAAAGPGLLAECETLGGCKTGDAKITKGYSLPAKYVIHTVGPVYKDGHSGEEELLRSCYRKSLALAEENGCESVAFPMISAGIYGYPWDDALDAATSEILSFLEHHEMTVYLVIYNGKIRHGRRNDALAFEAYLEQKRKRHEGGITPSAKHEREAFIRPTAGAAESENAHRKKRRSDSTVWAGKMPKPKAKREETGCSAETVETDILYSASSGMQWQLDESFSKMLLRKIDESGMTDAECYKKANVDKRLFSKIRSNPAYQPKKATALAFAIALRLSVEETEKLLKTAGFALSDSSLFDVIVRYHIERGYYDVFRINEVLFDNDQPLLGSVA